jgi:VIT1/CCC1 family predicted Fe2+/Mn2+ transporter
VASPKNLIAIVSAASLIFLIVLGILAARVGGANIWKGAGRVGFWGALAMAITAGIGTFFGAVV